jgi:hypothetical protein
MTYAFGIYFEDDDNLGLVAAGSRWTSGGNSTLARRARVAMQRRDRYGRWAEMGGGIAFSGRNSNNQVVKMVGRYVGPAERPEYMRVYVTSGRGIQPGIYEVPSKVATVAKALLGEDALKDAGVKLDVNGKTVGDILDRDIEFIAGMFKGKPTDFELDMARKNLTKAETRVIEKARLKAPAHKSYNIVDKDGNRIDKDEEPTTPDVQKPSKKAKPAKKFPLPDLSKLEPKDRSRLEFWVGSDGKRLKDGMVTDAIKADPKNYRVRTKDGLLDGNGDLVEFNPTFKPEASPLPTREEDKVVLGDDGFINANNVRPGEIRKDITDAQELYEHLFNGGYAEVPIELALEALAISKDDSQYLGRSKNPYIDTHDSRDPKFVEIASKLESLSRWQQNRLERAISLALMDEKQLDDFKAWLDNNLEEGILLTDEQLVDAHKKFRNLGVDITNARVKGTDIFTNDNLGALRKDMPQLDDPDQPEFLAELERLGIKSTNERVNVKELKPVQAEMDMGSVAFLEQKFADPESRKGFDSKRLVVTRDGYVLDGHHRYAAAYLASLRTGEPIELNIVRLDLDLEDALKIANEWNDHAGIFRQQIGGQFEAKPRPEAPKVEAPAAPAPRMNMNMAPAGPQGPDGSPIEDWLAKNLTDNGDLIKAQFADRLTEDKPNAAEPQSPIPGSKTVVRNLLKYKESLRKGLLESALDGDREAFKFKYEIAKRVSNLLDQIYDNLLNGHNYTRDLEIAISTSNPDEKLKAFRILPDSMVTEVDNNGVKIIKKFNAITIGKNGVPFVIRWNSSGRSDAIKVKPDGSVNLSAREGDSDYAGGLGHSSVQSYSVLPDGKLVPETAISGSAFTDKKHQALGLMSGHIFLTRWVQNQFMPEARLSHSFQLYAPGTFYSKTVSKDMRDHNRTQADKAIHQNNPNGDIFKVLSTMGLVDGNFVPYDKNAPDDGPSGGGGNARVNGTREVVGGSGWLRRLTPSNQTGGDTTKSVLNSFSVNSAVANYLLPFRAKTEAEQQALLADIPEIFKDFLTGDVTRPDWQQYQNFDVQYKLLGTVYSDGMKKQEAVEFLDKLITGLPQLHRAFGQPSGTTNLLENKLKELKDAIEMHQWDQANNNYNRPKDFNTNSLRVLESPFAGNFKFSDWNVGRDLTRIVNELPFTPSGKPNGAPDHWTENPNELEARFSPETLLEVLTDSLKNRKGKVARLPEDMNGNSPIDVNPTAVYKALENRGFDTEKMLAEIYDEINGNSTNLDTLLAKRSELGNLNDIITNLIREVGGLEEPIAFSKIGGQYDADSRVLQSDLIKRSLGNPDGNPALNLQELQPVNETYYNTSRDRLITSLPYTPQIPGRDFYTVGIADNPKIIARNFSPIGLKNALFDALQNNRTKVKLRFPNNSELEVDNSAIRDALQHQGVDINKLLSEFPGLKPAPRQLNEISNEQDADGTVHRWTAIGDTQLRDNAPAIYEVYNDILGDGYYDIGVVNGKDSDKRTFTAKLARIKKNADGNFEVWVAKKEDNFTGEFTGTPDGVYVDYTNAMYDIKTHIMADSNLANATTVLEGNGRQPSRSSNLTEKAVLDDRDVADQGTVVGGMTIVRPRDAEKLQIFSNIDDTIRINAANALGINGADFTYGLATNPNAPDGSPLESVISYSKNVDGSTLETEIYSIKKVASSGQGDEYIVSLRNQDGSVQNFHFDNLDNARNVARLAIGEKGSLTIPGVYESRNTLQQGLAGNVPSADFDSQSTVRTSANVTVSTDVNLPSGVQGIVSVVVKKGAHPSWRRNVPDADNQYVYATADITSPEGDNYASYSVVRTGLQKWSVRRTLSPRYASTGNSHLTGNLEFYRGTYRNKTDALEQLRRNLDTTFQPGVNNEDRKTLVPTDAVINSATNAPDAIDPNAPVTPSENFLSDSKFSDFVAERGELLDLTGAVRIGRMGLGASHSDKYELNGKKYKVKIEGSNKARQESFNHAIYKLTGIQVTEARIATNVPNQPAGTVVVADELEPNIVRGIVNGHMNSQVLFEGDNFIAPENQQAIADMHEGLLMDVLTGNGDMMDNEGNSFVAIRDGVRRGVRCDNGSGGLYAVIGGYRVDFFTGRNATDRLTRALGNFMPNGTVSNSSRDGVLTRGLTKDAILAIARRTILPLTDDKIDSLVNSIMSLPADKADLAFHLKRRRLEMLNYMGIDPNEEPPQGAAARVPSVIPGNTPPTPPTISNDGYEILPADANGIPRVRIPGTAGPDGVYKATDYDNLPADLKSKLLSGKVLPEYLPFVSHGNVDNPTLVIDGAGIVRPIGKNGMTSILLRKRKSDGTYEYLYIKQGATGNLKVKQSGENSDKLMPIVHNNEGGSNLPLEDMLASEGFAGIPIVGSKEMLFDIPGLGQNHRFIVADIGSEDISGVLSRASQGNVINNSYWKTKERLDNAVAGSYYYDQLNAGNDRADVIAQLERWERNWAASPSPEPSADNDGGVGGNGPTNPSGNGGNVPSGSSGSSNDDYLPLASQTLRNDVGGVRDNPVTVDVQARLADGALKVTEANTGEVLGRIKPTFHGHWEATLLPDQIGNQDRNGEAVKGIFANKIDAQNWLATKIYDKYNVARGTLGERKPIGEVGTAGQQLYNPNATPLVAISKGYLNPSTENQRNFANRLIEHKQATAEERALFRAILTQDNLTVGEVGWVIGKLRDRDDRDSAELAESRRVREEAAAANPIQPSSLEAVVQAPDTLPIFAKKLKVGQRIVGKVNGNVVFTAEGENNTINVGIVGDDGKLKVYKVGRNTILGVANQPIPATAPNANAPTHPVIQQRRAQARLIQDRIKALYPNHRELANGDLVVGQRDVVQADGSRFRYEAVVHKLKSDEFVSYVRKQPIDAAGNPIGQGEAAYLTVPGHSPKAVINRLGREVMPVISARNPANGFNQRDDKQAEAINPATGLPLPSKIVDQDAQYIGDTGIEKTGNAAKDALISYVQGLVARGQAQPEIVEQIMGGNQRLFSRQQMDDIVERLEWNRQFPGTNAIPYVSKDNKTIVRVGDRVTHYDADGNPKIMENGQPRTGIVTERRPYTLNRKPNGDYEYTDQLFVQWDDTNRPHQAAARRLEVNRRVDGAAPVPAVQGPVSGRDNNPPIAPMPLPRGSQAPGQPPATPVDSQDIANIGNVRILVVPNGPTYEVQRENNGTQFRDVNVGNYSNIYVIQRGGKWAVKNADGINRQTLTEFDTRNEAEANAMDVILANNAPAAPAPAENSIDLREAISTNSVIRDFITNGGGQLVSFPGAEMFRITHPQSNGVNSAVADIKVDPNGEYVVSDYSNGFDFRYVPKSVALEKLQSVVENFARNLNPNAPENNDSGVTQKMEQYRGQIPYPYSLVRIDDFVNLGGGNPITLRDDLADADGLNSLRGRIFQDDDGKVIVQKWGRNGGALDREVAKDLDDALQRLVNHAFAMRLERDRDRDNAPESSSPSSSSPTSPDGGGGGVPPNNPPAGGDGGASDGPGLDLNPGRWRRGEPPQGVVRLDGRVPKIDTFWDDDQPPTQYDVVRDENRTKFIGRAGDNPGAEAFVYVEKTPLGNWRMVDPRERGDARYSAEYGDRNVAEAIAINKMAGREDLNPEVLGRRPNVAPQPTGGFVDEIEAVNGLIVNRSEGMSLFTNPDGSTNEIQVVAIGNGKAWQVTRNRPGQNPEVLSTHATRENGEIEARARIAQENAPEDENNNPLSNALNNAGDTPTGFGYTRPDLNTYILTPDAGDAASAGIQATVTKLPNGEYNSTVTNNDNFSSRTFDSALEAVNHAHGKVTEARNNNINGNRVSPTNNQPSGTSTTDSESPTSGNSDSELRVGEFRGPDGMVENREADGNFTADFNIGQSTFQRIRTPNGGASYYYRGIEIATTEKNSDGTFNVRTIWGAGDSDFTVARDEENALLNAQSQIWKANQSGRIEQMDQDFADGNIGQGEASGNAPATPARPNVPVTPAVPAIPAQPNQQPIPEFAYPGEIVNGQMNVGGGVGGENDFRDMTPQPQAGAVLRQYQPRNIGGNYNPGFYWENSDGTVSKWDDNRDGPRFRRPIPPSWEEPDNSGVRYRPGDVFNPNQGPSDGGNPPAGPSGGDGGNPPAGPLDTDGGNGGNPPTSNPPAGPAPVAPEAEPAQEPQGQPRVNRIKPGDRYIKQNNRLLPNKDGKYTRFDVYDARTKKLIASAETKEIADDIAAGIRDLNGKLIDYTTPLKPGIQRVPRPEGYSRNITPDSQERMFNKDFYIENLNDPNAPVVGLDYDEANAQYVGQLYANKEDAKNRRNPIGEPFSNSAQIRAEDAAHSAIQKELDKRNAPAPAPATPEGQQPAGERIDSRADLGNVLKWQSGSDGKAYLGLEGVPNSPVIGISALPFNRGWVSVGWRNQAEKDAGARGTLISEHEDEQGARDAAVNNLTMMARLLGLEMPNTPTE